MMLSIGSLLARPVNAQTHIENVSVETYYISDANDATDTIGGLLVEGSRTYRIYLDLDSCASLRSVYGDVNHPLLISSTTPFFNNLDRGKTYGHQLNNGAVEGENTVALDSWLSLGAASNARFGTLKADDPDGSAIANDGGSAGIPGGLLANTDADAGIPITAQDGLMLGTASVVPPSFAVLGITPDGVFNDSTLASSFTSYDTHVGCSTPGVKGPTAENRILIAQLTTAGDLMFHLNVEVELCDGSVVKYVSSDSVLLADETPNGLLSYPPECGCTDPDFLEYDPSAGCDDGSCATTIMFGCLDTLACNFDPAANYNVVELCCYGPGDCNGLDVSIICPDLGTEELAHQNAISAYIDQNGESSHIIWTGATAVEALISVFDATGRPVVRWSGMLTPDGSELVDLRMLRAGWYVLNVGTGSQRYALPFVKP